MIYNRTLKIYTVQPGKAPTEENLQPVRSHMYGDKTIYAKRIYDAVQAGYQLDRLLEIPGWYDYKSTEYVKPGDGGLYRLAQAERRRDENGLPCMWLSLSLIARIWADELILLKYPEKSKGDNGYDLPDAQPEERKVICSIVQGLDSKDSYTGDKSRLRSQVTVEVYDSDYYGERKAIFRGRSYEIQSATMTERYTQRLELLEVIR